jgi:hypothetical protein
MNSQSVISASSISRAQALRIISKLRLGTDSLEGVNLFSAGRAPLLRAAIEQFEELEISGGANVRWVRGRIGQGKTHLFARLIHAAQERSWVTSYVQVSEPGCGVELHRFEQVYAAIVRNIHCREQASEESGRDPAGQVSGWSWVLERWWEAIRRQVTGRQGGDTPTFRLQETVDQNVTAIRRTGSMHPSFAEGLRAYANAQMDGEIAWAAVICDWFQGVDVHSQGAEVRARLRRVGIPESINRRNAKDILRSLSRFLQYRGHRGVLLLIDELENVLHQNAVARRAAWTILRELIDNVDDRHGMSRTAFYIAATPDVFESEKGMNEYAALADRVLLPSTRAAPNPLAPIIDLAAWPLRPEDLEHAARSITALHGVAMSWQPGSDGFMRLHELLHDSLRSSPELTVRGWVKIVIERLDAAREQHRG